MTAGKERGHVRKHLPQPRHELRVVCTRVLVWRWREEASCRIHIRGRKDKVANGWMEQEPQEKDPAWPISPRTRSLSQCAALEEGTA